MSVAVKDAAEILIGQSWSRWIPDSGIAFYQQWATILGPVKLTRPVLTELPLFDGMFVDDRGWDSPAWDQLRPYAALDLAHIHVHLEQEAAAAGADPVTARAQQRARIDTAAIRLGVGALISMHDVFAYMLACGLITEHPGEDPPAYSLSTTPALPSHILSLPEQETARETNQYDRYRYAEAAERILALADAGDARLTTSVERLAKKIFLDGETTRSALAWLMRQGIVHTDADIAHLDRYKVFQLAMAAKSPVAALSRAATRQFWSSSEGGYA